MVKHPPPPGKEINAYLKDCLGEHDANRLISARLAERAATEYYKTIGLSVEDISITQLNKNNDQWRDFDILVDGKPIDVKNARKSYTSPNSYVQHCIPQFKKFRKTEVIIVGTLSEYVSFYKKINSPPFWPDNFDEPFNSPSFPPDDFDEQINNPPYCTVLGEVSISKIRKIYKWSCSRFGEILGLKGIWKPEFQPGWAFEYPPEHYRFRSDAIAKIPEVLLRFNQLGVYGDRVPGWLLSMCPDHSIITLMTKTPLEEKILTDLHSLEEYIDISRPTIFILIMGLFLESMFKCELADDLAATLRRLLMVELSVGFKPLGLDDPQNYISSLIDCLEKVHEEGRRREMRFKSFEMTHPSILKGQTDNGKCITLIAYCGGWKKYPITVRCGKTPLFFGTNDICPSCGHLICDACGFCSQTCTLVNQRQDKIVSDLKNFPFDDDIPF